jgi:tetratricopeptide (TPR) repeat protein
VFNKAGRFQEAAQVSQESLDACRQAQIADVHPLVAASSEDLGNALAGLKRYREAIPMLEKAVEINRQLGSAYTPIGDRIQAVLNEVRRRR